MNAPWPAAPTGYEKDARSRALADWEAGPSGHPGRVPAPPKGRIAKSLILCAFEAELFEGNQSKTQSGRSSRDGFCECPQSLRLP